MKKLTNITSITKGTIEVEASCKFSTRTCMEELTIYKNDGTRVFIKNAWTINLCKGSI